MDRRIVIFAGVVVAGGVFLCLCAILAYVALVLPAARQTAEREAAFGALSSICEGGAGQPAAATYVAGSGRHLIVGFSQEDAGWTVDFSSYPEEWAPATLAEAELVLCLGAEEEVLVETCDYFDVDAAGNLVGDPSYVERYQFQQNAVIYEAQTGRQVVAEALFGTVPDECGDEVFFDDDFQVVPERGDKITAESREAWLRTYVIGASAFRR